MLRIFQRFVTIGAIGWAVLVVATPRLAAASRGDDWRLRLATAAYVTGSAICHQRPERSFHYGELPLPVCARCTGIYVGAALGVMTAFVGSRRTGRLARWRRVILIALAPMAISWIAEWMTPIPVSNAARALTGVMAGAAVAAFVIRAPMNE